MRWWLVVSILISLISVLTGRVWFRVHSKRLDQCMRNYNIVPQVIPDPPFSLLTIDFPSGINVQMNDVIPAVDTDVEPLLHFYYDDRWYYTVVMIDPDLPTPGHRVNREHIHWLVGNFKGNDCNTGETIVEYMGSRPKKNSGYHRYVVLVYEHMTKRYYGLEKFINQTTIRGRNKFSIKRFHEMYALENLVTGNYFRTTYDPWQSFNFSKYINISNY